LQKIQHIFLNLADVSSINIPQATQPLHHLIVVYLYLTTRCQIVALSLNLAGHPV
jgi:hypothetical protein